MTRVPQEAPRNIIDSSDIPIGSQRNVGGVGISGAGIERPTLAATISTSDLHGANDTAIDTGTLLMNEAMKFEFAQSSIYVAEPDGGVQELCSVAVLAGERAVGIVATHSEGSVTSVRLVELPLEGVNATEAPRTIADIDITSLNEPSPDGLVQNWRVIKTISRSDFEVANSYVSRKHLVVDVTKGGVMLSDISTHGTVILDDNSAGDQPLWQKLKDNPELWSISHDALKNEEEHQSEAGDVEVKITAEEFLSKYQDYERKAQLGAIVGEIWGASNTSVNVLKTQVRDLWTLINDLPEGTKDFAGLSNFKWQPGFEGGRVRPVDAAELKKWMDAVISRVGQHITAHPNWYKDKITDGRGGTSGASALLEISDVFLHRAMRREDATVAGVPLQQYLKDHM